MSKLVYSEGSIWASWPSWPIGYAWYLVTRDGRCMTSKVVPGSNLKCGWVVGPPMLDHVYCCDRGELIADLIDYGHGRFGDNVTYYVDVIIAAHTRGGVRIKAAKPQALYLWIFMPGATLKVRSAECAKRSTPISPKAFYGVRNQVYAEPPTEAELEKLLSDVDYKLLEKLYQCTC